MISPSAGGSTVFWQSRKGIFLQILFVPLPMLFCLTSFYLLFGLSVSVLSAWLMLRLRNKRWRDNGLTRPENVLRLAVISSFSAAILLPLSCAVKAGITAAAGTPPNLAVFDVLKGNLTALLAGLTVAWIFGAFLEELFLRGFCLPSFYELLPEQTGRRLRQAGAVLLTSVFASAGHFYQGTAGMFTAGFISAGFSVIYLLNKRNLWSSILAHGLYDTAAFFLVYRDIRLESIMFG
ncbi:MAG: CPBP family intramembrane metalloprotease [Planctomycetaceae bacterium]|jgi:membrane protease YdiL (CAAX protease family)|nr:CPBP family intramembrane metalloprotease [Planctomycetaceae bacterium]